MAGNNVQELREWWKHQESLEKMHDQMLRLDKKLSRMNDEMLYYTLMRVTSILEFREKSHE